VPAFGQRRRKKRKTMEKTTGKGKKTGRRQSFGKRLLFWCIAAATWVLAQGEICHAQECVLEGDGAHVYAGMDEGSGKVGYLMEGSAFTVLETYEMLGGDNWYRVVMAGGTEGYIHASAGEVVPADGGALAEAPPDEAAPQEGDTPEAGTPGTEGQDTAGVGEPQTATENPGGTAWEETPAQFTVRTTVGAKVRREPDTASAALGTVKEGREIGVTGQVVTAEGELWYHVLSPSDPELEGYMSAELAERVGTEPDGDTGTGEGGNPDEAGAGQDTDPGTLQGQAPSESVQSNYGLGGSHVKTEAAAYAPAWAEGGDATSRPRTKSASLGGYLQEILLVVGTAVSALGVAFCGLRLKRATQEGKTEPTGGRRGGAGKKRRNRARKGRT